MIKNIVAAWLSIAALFAFVASVEPARDFDGVTDRIDWAAPVVLGTGQAMTASMWLFPVTRDGSGTAIYFLTVHNSGDANFGFVFFDQNNSSTTRGIGFQVRQTSGAPLNKVAGFASLSTGAWQHVLVTWDGTFTDNTTVHIYVDGAEVGYEVNQNGSGTQSTPDGSWSLGGRIFDDTRNFDGRIAEPAFFTRVLTDAEIDLLSGTNPTQAPLSPNCLTPGPAWYPINGLGGETPNDGITGTAATLDGTTVVAHPSIRYCMEPFTFDIPVVVPPGGVGHLGGAHLGRAKTGGAHIP